MTTTAIKPKHTLKIKQTTTTEIKATSTIKLPFKPAKDGEQRIPVRENPNNIHWLAVIRNLFNFEFNLTVRNEFVYIHPDRVIEATSTQLTDLIKLVGDDQQRFLARILWQFYSSGNLKITDCPYQKYLDWTNYHRSIGLGKMSIDHILPRCKYPTLTFDWNNWQPLSLEDNKIKGNS
jgi:hypothetical protein